MAAIASLWHYFTTIHFCLTMFVRNLMMWCHKLAYTAIWALSTDQNVPWSTNWSCLLRVVEQTIWKKLGFSCTAYSRDQLLRDSGQKQELKLTKTCCWVLARPSDYLSSKSTGLAVSWCPSCSCSLNIGTTQTSRYIKSIIKHEATVVPGQFMTAGFLANPRPNIAWI